MRWFWLALLVLAALLLSPVTAQPVITGWRPPTGCSTNQVIGWNGSAWTCQTPTSFSTSNVIPKGNGSTLAASSWTDDGTTSSTSGDVDVTGTVTVATRALIDQLVISEHVTTAALSSGTTDDWNPTGLEAAGILRIQTDTAGSTLGGLQCPTTAGTKEGRMIFILNHGDGNGSRGEAPLTILHRSTGTSAHQRFVMPDLTDLEIPYTGGALFTYEGDCSTNGAWFLVATTTGGFFRRATVGDLRFTPIYPSALSSGNNNNYSPANWAKASLVFVEGHASGSTLTGLAYYGGSVGNDPELNATYKAGYTKVIVNRSIYPIRVDCEDNDSSAGNRIICPYPMTHFYVMQDESLVLVYDFTSGRWRVVSDRSGAYPKLTLTEQSTPSALSSGDTNDYEPTGWATIGHWRLQADGGGSNLTGMKGLEEGAIRTITNYNATLTIVHQSGSSAAGNKFYNPGAGNINLSVGCSAIFRYDLDGGGSWFMLGKSC